MKINCLQYLIPVFACILASEFLVERSGHFVELDREQWSLGWISMRSWSRSVVVLLELLF